eukprot:972159-Alexandrium_andersonii.AAC.1
MGGACAASNDAEVKKDGAQAITIVADSGWMVVTMVAVLIATWVLGFVGFGRGQGKGDTDPPVVEQEPDEEPEERRADAR